MSRKKKLARKGAKASSARRRPAAPRRPVPGPARRERRSRTRWLIYAVVVIAYVAIMWFWVFPWVDRTFVNRPAV